MVGSLHPWASGVFIRVNALAAMLNVNSGTLSLCLGFESLTVRLRKRSSGDSRLCPACGFQRKVPAVRLGLRVNNQLVT